MLEIIKSQNGPVLSLIFKGVIEENSQIEDQIGPLPTSVKEIAINTRAVSRINSGGVKLWIKYFSAVTKSGINLILQECSPTVVQQINFISNFACGGKIESILLPFTCNQCKNEMDVLMITAQFNHQEPKPMTCPKCGGSAVFDDIASEYFLFLSRARKK